MFSFKKSTNPIRCGVCRHCKNVTVPVDKGFKPMIGPGEYSTNWADRYTNEERLQCKRMPPSPNAEGWGVSPYVHDYDYCGEFEAKD